MAGTQTPWEQASEWFGRTLAIVVVMVTPGAAGAWLDARLGTTVLAVLGFGFGMLLAITMLLLFTKIRPAVGDSFDNSQRRSSTSSGSFAPTASADKHKTLPSEMPLPEVPGAEVLDRSEDR